VAILNETAPNERSVVGSISVPLDDKIIYWLDLMVKLAGSKVNNKVVEGVKKLFLNGVELNMNDQIALTTSGRVSALCAFGVFFLKDLFLVDINCF
jgi:hypothetical protein